MTWMLILVQYSKSMKTRGKNNTRIIVYRELTFLHFLPSDILVIILSILFLEETVKVDAYTSDGCMSQAMKKTVYLHKCIWGKFANFIFPPKNSNFSHVSLFCHPSFAFSLSPCLPSPWVCPGSPNSVRTCRFCLLFTSGGCHCRVLEMPSLLLLLRQDSAFSAGYSFHLWTHTPWLYCLSKIHLWGVCQIWSPQCSSGQRNDFSTRRNSFWKKKTDSMSDVDAEEVCV